MCRPYLTFYPSLYGNSNNIVTISLIHSNSPLSFWKDDELNIFLIEQRKACPLTTDSSFVHCKYIPGLICAWGWLFHEDSENFFNLSLYECLTQFYPTNLPSSEEENILYLRKFAQNIRTWAVWRYHWLACVLIALEVVRTSSPGSRPCQFFPPLPTPRTGL